MIFSQVPFFFPPRAPHNCFLNTWSISKTICYSPSGLLHFSELKNQHSLPTRVFNQFYQSALLLDQQVSGRQEHKTSPINAGHSLSYLSTEGFSLARGILTTFTVKLSNYYEYYFVFFTGTDNICSFVKTRYHLDQVTDGTKHWEVLFLVGLKPVFSHWSCHNICNFQIELFF